MKVSAVSGDLMVKLGIGLGLAVIAFVLLKKSGGVAAQIANAINPASPDNIINRGVNAIGAAVSGNPNFTVGGAIYEATHKDPVGQTTYDLATIRRQRAEREAEAERLRESRRGRMDDDVVSPQIIDGFGNPIYPFP